MSTLYHGLASFTISGLTLGAIYAVMAFGYTIVYRILGLFNFAHGGVYMVASFVAMWVVNATGVASDAHGLTVVWVVLAMLAAAAGAGLVLSVALEYGIFRPIRVRQGGGLPALVAGLGAITMMQEAFGLWKGRSPIGMPQPVAPDRLFTIFGGGVSLRQLVVFGAAIVALLAAERYVALARSGRALRAVGQDARTAALMGINVERVIVIAFVLAGVTAGLAATLSDLYFGNTSYFSGFSLGIKGFTAALLGGMGSVPGALVGGLVLGLAESYGGAVWGAQWADVIAFGALIFILVTRPRGIVGQRMAMVRA